MPKPLDMSVQVNSIDMVVLTKASHVDAAYQIWLNETAKLVLMLPRGVSHGEADLIAHGLAAAYDVSYTDRTLGRK